MKFTETDYNNLRAAVFLDGYPGYKPAVQESPNGDGVWDEQKRYAHVAPKYGIAERPILLGYYARGFAEARRVAAALDVPRELWPDWDECCLRVLYYPPGAGSAQHTDFDLFTIQLYRDQPEGFVRTFSGTAAPDLSSNDEDTSPGIHWGEMAEVAGIRSATPHFVRALDVPQRSIVFFALPAPHAVLARDGFDPVTAGEWLAERYARSRRG